MIIALGNFAREHRLGAVLDSSTGFWMFNHNCRAPDVSFVPARRLQSLGFKPSERRFFPGAPDLAIEILSPNNTRAEIVDPENQTAEICHAQTDRRLIGSGALLEASISCRGFQLPLADLFKDREWE